jgi:hypothetical protein
MSKGGKGYRVGTTPCTPHGRLCYDLCVRKPHLNISQITKLVQKEYPGQTGAMTRKIAFDYGLTVAKRDYVPNPNTTYKGKPKIEPRVAPKPTRASVHGYSGRSRTLAGYYEL